MTTKPYWWNNLHDAGMNALTKEWKSYRDIKRETGLFLNVFDDLRSLGCAEERRDSLMVNGSPAGERIYLRLKEDE